MGHVVHLITEKQAASVSCKSSLVSEGQFWIPPYVKGADAESQRLHHNLKLLLMEPRAGLDVTSAARNKDGLSVGSKVLKSLARAAGLRRAPITHQL